MLPAIKRAVGDRVPIIVDGGVRRGTDILKVGCRSRCWLNTSSVGSPHLQPPACSSARVDSLAAFPCCCSQLLSPGLQACGVLLLLLLLLLR